MDFSVVFLVRRSISHSSYFNLPGTHDALQLYPLRLPGGKKHC